MSEIYFFIPIFFDASSFQILRARLLEQFTNSESSLKHLRPHFILLDDSAGSDESIPALSSLPDVEVLQMPFNLGHQRALVYGLRVILARKNQENFMVVTLDGDGEDRPEDLKVLFDEFLRHEKHSPFVLARRTKREESLFFKTFYVVYKNMFRLLTGIVIQNGNFALMCSRDLRKIISHPYFDLAYASTFVSLSLKIRFVPCARGQRYEGKSKMNFTRLAIHGIRMLMPFMDRIAIRGVISFSFFFCLSLATVASLGILRLQGILAVPGSVLVAFVSCLLISMIAVCNFAILITIFANMQALALSRIEDDVASGTNS